MPLFFLEEGRTQKKMINVTLPFISVMFLKEEVHVPGAARIFKCRRTRETKNYAPTAGEIQIQSRRVVPAPAALIARGLVVPPKYKTPASASINAAASSAAARRRDPAQLVYPL